MECPGVPRNLKLDYDHVRLLLVGPLFPLDCALGDELGVPMRAKHSLQGSQPLSIRVYEEHSFITQ